MRQDSTLIYTGGALTWHVSILLRNKKPLPFSEEQDNHIDCIMGIGPDIMIFVDYHTKVWNRDTAGMEGVLVVYYYSSIPVLLKQYIPLLYLC